jgi:hypothetical protein
MLADLWTDLLNPGNRRGQAVLAAILYVFCPAAARWWLAGADPVIPFDPLREAYRMRESGRTLREVLDGWGLGELTGHARKFVEQVEAFRDQNQHRHLTAPELLPTFLGGRLPVADRHGLAAAFENIGGWQNFYPFVRVWAFSLRDWQTALGWPAIRRFERLEITTTAFSKGPLQITVWSMAGPERTALGLLAGPGGRGAWCAEIISHCLGPGSVDNLFLLFETGQVQRVEARFGVEAIQKLIERSAGLARNGPFLPMNALNDPSSCRRCGFNHLCWENGGKGLTPIAVAR